MSKFWKLLGVPINKTKKLELRTLSSIEHIIGCFDFRFYDERPEYHESFIEITKSGYYLVVRYWYNGKDRESTVKLENIEDSNYILDKFLSSNLNKIDLNYLDLDLFTDGDYKNKYLALKELIN